MSDDKALVPGEPAPDNDGENSNDPPLSEGTIESFIEAQREETEAKREEIELRKRELELNQEHARRALEAQREDRERYWDHLNQRAWRQEWIGAGIIVLVLVFVGFLVWLDETEFALELAKIALYGGGGYYAGKAIGKREADEDQEP